MGCFDYFTTLVYQWCDCEHVMVKNNRYKRLWNKNIYSLKRIQANTSDLAIFDKFNQFMIHVKSEVLDDHDESIMSPWLAWI